jgi:hypothetical protein
MTNQDILRNTRTAAIEVEMVNLLLNNVGPGRIGTQISRIVALNDGLERTFISTSEVCDRV